MSNRELRSLVADNTPTYVPSYLHQSQTIYSKTLRSGTTYAQYRDTEDEKKGNKPPSKVLLSGFRVIGNIEDEKMFTAVGNDKPQPTPGGYYREFNPENETRTDALFYPR